MSSRVAVVGIGWSGFREVSPELSYKELMYAAAVRAYEDAGINPIKDVDSFITVAEDFHEGTSIFDEYTPDQLGAVLKPMQTISGDGLHGLATGYLLIKTGQFRIVVVEGHSKASNIKTLPEVTGYAQDPVINRPLRINSEFIAGLDMSRYLFESGTTREQCAAVVCKNKKNALMNSSAPYGGDFCLNEILGSEPIAWPLGIAEIAKHSDGAIVMVLADEETARALTDNPVYILGVGWCNGSASLEYRNWGSLPYITKAAQMAYKQSGFINPAGIIEFAEVDDTYAYKELQSLESLGLYAPGEAGARTIDGDTQPDGLLPVNVSGGSLGMGHLLDATGLSRALEIVLQLRGIAGARQLNNVEIGLAQSWRGVPTTSGAVVVMSNS
jgi:acetyl-CoA C-acetyltransferase